MQDGMETSEGEQRLLSGASVARLEKKATCDEADEPVSNGAMIRVARTVNKRLDEELGDRDEDRARRSVATVRPAMTALCYVRPDTDDDNETQDRRTGREHQTGEGGSVTEATEYTAATLSGPRETMTGVRTADVIAGADNEVMLTSVATGVESTDTVDAVETTRSEAKKTRKDEKERRVQRARKKMEAIETGGDEVDQAVAALKKKQQDRRQREANGARLDLAARQQQQQSSPEVTAGERAKESLVQRVVHGDGDARDNHGGSEGDAGGLDAAASNGLPTALMDIDGERVHVKLDSGVRYSVAGTDWMLRGEMSTGGSSRVR
ncbi:hypothetical protein PF005_g25385 [Phytophthora fragariae]|uniref:Uncharacterized protein n=1 Tax=Phytophthora fragariae TaxID=53985 RepID=A0A6A3I3Q0_9STRA|nr:hypothetical protein PF003_g15805 [Phytophthora fragariae]KAE8976032.1 hypothetical protein PF011_g24221 [Phytophthora fragariae]KAE9073768.1 hypothetical protein PF010_g24939 [Phytophthora fragariae]KAE9175475.1 hypothetical protein PF005_g25385 [Phytophthora fragariae]KAE9279542.1 hypothetical protein PF001_g24668 [Phytophthora fragariae]